MFEFLKTWISARRVANYKRGYAYGEKVWNTGNKSDIEELEVLADGTFDNDDFDRGVTAALRDGYQCVLPNTCAQ